MYKDNEIRLLIFDIDGTLVPNKTLQVVPSAKEAIQKAKANGFETMLATGRPYYFVLPDVIDAVKPDWIVSINGAALVDGQYDYQIEYGFTLAETRKAMDLFKNEKITGGLKCAHELYAVYDYPGMFQKYGHGSSFFEAHIKDGTQFSVEEMFAQKPFGGFFFTLRSHQDIVNLFKDFGVADMEGEAWDLYPKATNKMRLIEETLDMLHLTWNNVLAIGDGENDLEMVGRAKYGVCMGNGDNSVKAVAAYVTSDINDDGVEKALRHYKVIQ
ncbi:MAG: HAD family hydrolase [Erysipelotrichaceae bacterium]|jgi:Cof subfamily protein (haloacid dehalogenase superfamily)|nr:HAD family hydrolase [Erysipelotrichaceae bacterium]